MPAVIRMVLSLLLCAVWTTLVAKVMTQDLTVDLRTGSYNLNGKRLTWLAEPEERSTTDGGCDVRGLLKITFSNKRVRTRILMKFENPANFSFNIGDSRTNNGWGGDAGTQDKDAEVFAWNQELVLASNQKAIQNGSHEYIYQDKNFIGLNDALTLDVGNNLFSAERAGSDRFLYFNSFLLFALKGQEDLEGGENRDIFLGMNRVVHDDTASTADGTGAGLCSVEITWYDSY